MGRLSWELGLCVAVAAGSVHAAPPPDEARNIHLGFRSGYGLPFGGVREAGTQQGTDFSVRFDDLALSDFYVGMIPLWLDAGYFVTDELLLGLYGQYGIGLVSTSNAVACPRGFECSGSLIRVGVQGQYHLARGRKFDPWFGLAMGYELATRTFSTQGTEVNYTARGFEFANLQGGVDLSLASGVGVGPFASFAVGQYSALSINPGGGTFPADIEDRTFHAWLVFGLHGAFGF